MLRAPMLSEAFFQADLVNGYGFLDTRGALVRQFREEFQNFAETKERNGMPSLLFHDPVDPEHPIVEFKVGLSMIWVHLRAEASNTAIRQECARVVEAACVVTGATQFSRQGVRTYHVFGTPTAEEAVRLIRAATAPSVSPWAEIGDVTSVALNVQLSADRIKANVHMDAVQTVRTRIITHQGASPPAEATPDNIPTIGVLLDADVFDDRRSDTRDPKPHLNRALRYIDEQILPLVTRLLRRGAEE